MSEPTKEQIDRMWLAVATSNEPQRALAQAIADATAPLHEKIASLEKQLAEADEGETVALRQRNDALRRAALAPPAQTQQGLSEDEGPQCMAVTRNGHQCSRAPHEELDDNHEAEGAADNGGTLLWTETYPIEKQPSPAAAPAQLSALATAQRGLDEWCKAAMQERARADAAEAKLAALAGQPAPTGLINQCDGCRAGRPIDKNGNHRMGDGDYPNLQACQRHLYSPAQPAEPRALKGVCAHPLHGDEPHLRTRYCHRWRRPPAEQKQPGKEGVGAAPEGEQEERACYHCDRAIMVPAGSPRIYTCGQCEDSAPDLSEVFAPPSTTERQDPPARAAPRAGETQPPSADELGGLLDKAAPGADYLAASLRGQFPQRTEAAGAPPLVTGAMLAKTAAARRVLRDAPPDGQGIDPDYETAAAAPEAGALGERWPALLAQLRAAGWAVAVHNDYRLNGGPHTFWLFTRGDLALKGEGRTDADALWQAWSVAETGPSTALSSPSGDARPAWESWWLRMCNVYPAACAALDAPPDIVAPSVRKPGFNEAMLPEGWAEREAARSARPWRSNGEGGLTLPQVLLCVIDAFRLNDASVIPIDDVRAAAEHFRDHSPVAPSILEEPKSPIVEPKAASQEESATICKTCGRAFELGACPIYGDGTAASIFECQRLGRERQRAEIEKLKAAHVADRRKIMESAKLLLADKDAAEAEVLRLTKEVQKARGPVMGICDKRSEARPWHAKIHYETSACLNFRHLELGQAAAIVEDPEVAGDAILYQSLIALLGELAEERDEARAASEQSRFLAADKQEELNAALAEAKALREATLAILDAAVERSPPTTATNDIEDPGFDYDGHAICMICGEGAGHDEPVVHGDDQPCGKLAALLAPPNPSAEKLTPGPRE